MSNNRSRRRPNTQTAPPAPVAPESRGLVLDRPENREATEKLVADREPLFTIGDTTYTIPKRVPPSWTIQAFTVATEQGEAAALTYATAKVLTPEAWEALSTCDTLTQDDLNAVFRAVMARILPEGVVGPKA